MERRGEGEERVFDAFGGGGFVELLGEGDLGGVGEMMGVEEVGGGGEHAVRLVEGDGVGVERFLLRCPPAYPPPSSSSPSPAAFRMLCFGGDEGDNGQDGFSRKSSDSCSSTSSYSSSSSSKKKTEGRRGTSTKATAARARATTATAPKKPRKEQPQGQQPPCSQRRASKGRKEKLGERISALQQLVSPFGKSDTASVLHEALGYIRFLHDQVQVLSSPYLQRRPSSAHLHGGVDGGGGAELRPDLRSRGLCLVPVACTAHVEASNGADFWSPAMGGGGDHRQPAVSKH